MTYRNPTLLRLAAIAPHCMVPGCGARNEGQLVSAHSNQQRDGKGTGLKASDAAVAFVCWTCHGRIDQGNESREIKTALWEAAHRATMRWLIETGHLMVSAVPTPPPVVATKPSRKIAKGRPIQSRGFDKPDVPKKIPSRPFQKAKADGSPISRRFAGGGGR